jgi:hypothetical protein
MIPHERWLFQSLGGVNTRFLAEKKAIIHPRPTLPDTLHPSFRLNSGNGINNNNLGWHVHPELYGEV